MGSASPSSSPASPAPRRVARERSKVVFADAPQRAGESQRIVESQTYIMLQPPSQQDFAKVAEGESRSEVVSALGVPWSHVTIPDDGHLVEIMSWYDGNRRVGTVRLDNGKVVSTVLN
jgi:hypothetical protein